MEIDYTVAPSTRQGKGLFAKQRVKRGERIWRCDDQSTKTHDRQSLTDKLQTLSTQDKTRLLEHLYTWDGKVVEILDDAKLWNHSRKHQNTGNHPDGDGDGLGDGVSSYALRDIEAGEELLDDYSSYARLEWFESLCVAHGARSCVAVGDSIAD